MTFYANETEPSWQAGWVKHDNLFFMIPSKLRYMNSMPSQKEKRVEGFIYERVGNHSISNKSNELTGNKNESLVKKVFTFCSIK